MTKFKLFCLKNEMLFANFIANLIGVTFVHLMDYNIVTPLHAPKELVSIVKRINAVFTPSAFILVIVVALIYERPIRRFLNFKYQNIKVSHGLQTKANRRVINEPFVMIALAFSMWLSAAFLFSIVWWALDEGPIHVQRAFFMNLNSGLITVTVAFSC
jgi:hypothetical protein